MLFYFHLTKFFKSERFSFVYNYCKRPISARDGKTIEFMSRNYVTSQVCNKQTFEWEQCA